jgi:hypothetical protein
LSHKREDLSAVTWSRLAVAADQLIPRATADDQLVTPRVTAVDELVLLAQAGGRREWLPPAPATTTSSQFDSPFIKQVIFDRFVEKDRRLS